VGDQVVKEKILQLNRIFEQFSDFFYRNRKPERLNPSMGQSNREASVHILQKRLGIRTQMKKDERVECLKKPTLRFFMACLH